METPAEATAEPSAPPEGTEAEALARALALEAGPARALVAAGLGTPEAVRAASDDALHAAGLSDEAIAHLRTPPPRRRRGGARPLGRGGEVDAVGAPRRPLAARPAPPPSATKGSTDVLRKWVDGDDRALQSWISSQGLRPAPGAPVLPGIPAPAEPRAAGPAPPAPAAGPPRR